MFETLSVGMTAEVKSSDKLQSVGTGGSEKSATMASNVDDLSCPHKIDQITALQDAVGE